MVKRNSLGCLGCFNGGSKAIKSHAVQDEPTAPPPVNTTTTTVTTQQILDKSAPVPEHLSSALEVLKTIPSPAPITVPGTEPVLASKAIGTAPSPPTPSPPSTPIIMANGYSALHEAAKLNRIQTVHQIISEQRVPVNAVDQRKRTSLHIACLAGSVAAAKALIQLGADVSAEDEMGRTPYLSAAFSPTPDIMPLLIEASADVNARDKEGNTALHLACWNGNIPVVKFLLDNGADAYATNQDQQTPLHKAAQQNEFEVVNRLVWAGAVVDETDQIGNTPLHIAARLGNTDVARYLLRHGAKLMALNKSKKTPGDVAMDEDMRKLLYDQEIAEMTSRLPQNIAMHPPKPPASVKSVAGSVTHSVDLPSTPGQESKKEARRVADDHSSICDFSVDLSTQDGSTTTVTTRRSASIKSTSTSIGLGLDSFVHPREMEQFTLLNSHDNFHMDPALKQFSILNTAPSLSPPDSRGPSPVRGSSPNARGRSLSPLRTGANGAAAGGASAGSNTANGKRTPAVTTAFPRTRPASIRTSSPASTRGNSPLRHSQSLAMSPVSSLTTPMSQFSRRGRSPSASLRSQRDLSPLTSARSKTSSARTPNSTTSSSRHTSRGPTNHFDIMSSQRTSVSDTEPVRKSAGHSRHRRSSSVSSVQRSSSLTRHSVHDIPEDKPVSGGLDEDSQNQAQFIRDSGLLQASMDKSFASTRSRAASVTSRASLRAPSISPLRGSSVYNSNEGARNSPQKRGVRPRGVWVP